MKPMLLSKHVSRPSEDDRLRLHLSLSLDLISCILVMPGGTTNALQALYDASITSPAVVNKEYAIPRRFDLCLDCIRHASQVCLHLQMIDGAFSSGLRYILTPDATRSYVSSYFTNSPIPEVI